MHQSEKQIKKIENLSEIRFIHFAFRNEKIIKYLKQRGIYLRDAKFRKAATIESQINEYKD